MLRRQPGVLAFVMAGCEGTEWFQGRADAVAQDLHLIETHRPDLVMVFGADHLLHAPAATVYCHAGARAEGRQLHLPAWDVWVGQGSREAP